MSDYTASDISRFWEKVDKNAPNGCWVWTGGMGAYKGRIPVFWDGTTQRSAIKVCYTILGLDKPKTSKFIRLCHNIRCINPEHVLIDSLENRFWLHVNKDGPPSEYTGDNCWEWIGGSEGAGYGRISINNRTIRPHVAAMIITGYKIPESAHVCHHCDNRICVRPSHLYIGDAKTNGLDRRMRPKPQKPRKPRKKSTL